MNLKNARLLRQYKRLIASRDAQLTPEMIDKMTALIETVFVSDNSVQRRKMANVLREAMPEKFSKRATRRLHGTMNKEWNIAAARDGLL